MKEEDDSEGLEKFYRERWLAMKLNLQDYDLGITTAEQRQDRVHSAVKSVGLATVCARTRGGPLTFGEAYRRTYGVAP